MLLKRGENPMHERRRPARFSDTSSAFSPTRARREKGWGTIPAAFAALLSDRVDQVTLKNALTSYTDIAESEDYCWPLSTLLPNVLKTFDLPDIYRALESKKLRTIEPVGANDAIS